MNIKKPQKDKTKNNTVKQYSVPSFNPLGHIKQPEWIEKKFPNLVSHQNHDHPLTSTRSLSHKGHQIEIVTTYEITIDGKKLSTHAMVDNEGKLWCHAIPYISFSSATEMVRSIIDYYVDVIGMEDASSNNEHDDNDTHHNNH
jgi:hypothetical protein